MGCIRELFGERIKEIRKKRGMTQKDVATILQIDMRSFGRIEKGNRSPSLDTLEKIACALSVEIKDLFEFEHLPKKEQTMEEAKQECVKLLNEAKEEEIKILLKIMNAVVR